MFDICTFLSAISKAPRHKTNENIPNMNGVIAKADRYTDLLVDNLVISMILSRLPKQKARG